MSDSKRWEPFTTQELEEIESALDYWDELHGLRQEGREVRDEITAELRHREGDAS